LAALAAPDFALQLIARKCFTNAAPAAAERTARIIEILTAFLEVSPTRKNLRILDRPIPPAIGGR
jgi:hypothetical protein